MLTVNFTPFPHLTTERLNLRQVYPADAKQLLLLRSDKKVMQYLDRPSFKSEDEALEMIERMIKDVANNDGISWAIALKEDTAMIGTIGFWRMDKGNHRAEIGYMLLPEFHGKGLMQEAMAAAIKYGFDEARFHSIEANVNPGNVASINILERNQFVREAYYRENYYYDGKFLDSAIYSLLTPYR
jgi:[ribosomal protein S5]-alanine N-acetyltransferase